MLELWPGDPFLGRLPKSSKATRQDEKYSSWKPTTAAHAANDEAPDISRHGCVVRYSTPRQPQEAAGVSRPMARAVTTAR